MELYQLEQFRVVAELEHITKASKVLMISQPAVSKTISNLEDELGTKLFDRVGKNIILNDNGRILLRYTKQIFELMHNMEQEFADKQDIDENIITLSVNAGSKVIPRVIQEFHKVRPGVKFNIVQEEAGKEHEYDFYIDDLVKPGRDKNTALLFREELLLAVPKNHPCKQEDSVALEDMRNESFLCLNRGANLTTMMENYCYRAGFIPKISMETSNPAILRDLIGMGLGIAMVPSVSWSGDLGHKVELVHISDIECFRYLTMAWKKGNYLSKAARDFKEFTIEFCKRYEYKKLGEEQTV